MNHLIRESQSRHAWNIFTYANTTLAILGLIEVPEDNLAFIVMEEWSPQLVSDVPCTLRNFFGAIRQCIEVRSFSPSSPNLGANV